MPFNPIAKSVKDIQEAYQNGKIDRDAVLAIYKERLNRPGKGRGWKNDTRMRYLPSSTTRIS